MGAVRELPRGAISNEVVNRLIALHTPTLQFHHEERYFPCDVVWFLRRAQLAKISGGRFQGPVLLDWGCVSQGDLLECQQQHANLALWIPDSEHRVGQHPEDLDEAVPVYAHAKLVCEVPEDPSQPVVAEALEITYLTFYAFNGEYPLAGLHCLPVGHHEGDWEHLTVRLQPPPGFSCCSTNTAMATSPGAQAPSTPQPEASGQETFDEQVPGLSSVEEQASAWRLQGVWYNSHRNCEGEWVEGAHVPRDPRTGRIKAFVARSGHGVYPRAGRTLRLFGAANDFTSDRGVLWTPTRVLRMCGTDYGPELMACASRGCVLPDAPTSHPAAPVPHDLPGVADDCSDWQRFKGHWGTSPAPVRQCWFHAPEPPLSRTHWQRLVWVCAPDVQRLPPGRRRTAPAAATAAAGTAAGAGSAAGSPVRAPKQPEEQGQGGGGACTSAVALSVDGTSTAAAAAQGAPAASAGGSA
mmetsp:Transcript_21896/g.55735  ORF Transcript_21896/g.55735 Transcript_21896/m.55735 type:complete len:467 (-) Transcript_21896:396-1796(-)